MNDYKVLNECRLCRGHDLRLQLDLGVQPLANAYVNPNTDSKDCAYPLRLVACNDCGHVQLDVTVSPAIMFDHYRYVSGVSSTLLLHFADLVDKTLAFWRWHGSEDSRKKGQARVLDLAANDGSLVATFTAAGEEAEGVDPAENLVKKANEMGRKVHCGYWPEAAKHLDGRKFDIITACNVLAHVDDPIGFVSAALDVLDKDGVLVIEVPYAFETFLNNEWDQIYHEHLSYFLVRPLLMAFNKIGASVVWSENLAIHGGSLRLYIQRPHPVNSYHCTSLGITMLNRETELGYSQPDEWGQGFSDKVFATGEALAEVINAARTAGKKVVGYGASAKGNTMLNAFPNVHLDYIVDDSKYKWGLATPGRRIPILSPDVLRAEEGQVAIVLLAWNFGREIIKRVRDWRGGEDDWISYVPRVCTGKTREFDSSVSA